MKLRLRGNSLRLRLERHEVAELRARGAVEDAIDFGPGARLAYRLARRDVPVLAASFDGRGITVDVPDAVALDFCDTDRVGFDGTAGGVRVLVEKDWQCLAPRGEDDGDAYPHPDAGKK